MLLPLYLKAILCQKKGACTRALFLPFYLLGRMPLELVVCISQLWSPKLLPKQTSSPYFEWTGDNELADLIEVIQKAARGDHPGRVPLRAVVRAYREKRALSCNFHTFSSIISEMRSPRNRQKKYAAGPCQWMGTSETDWRVWEEGKRFLW